MSYSVIAVPEFLKQAKRLGKKYRSIKGSVDETEKIAR